MRKRKTIVNRVVVNGIRMEFVCSAKPRRGREDYCERHGPMTHACFACMKTAKALAWSNPICPSCRKPMKNLGLSARVPVCDKKKWAKFEEQWRAGKFKYGVCR